MMRWVVGGFCALLAMAVTSYNMGLYKATQRNLSYGMKADRLDTLLQNAEFTLNHLNAQLTSLLSFQNRILDLESATQRLAEASKEWEHSVVSIQEQHHEFYDWIGRVTRPELVQLEEVRHRQERLEEEWWEQQHPDHSDNDPD